jgi:hypothetical protein
MPDSGLRHIVLEAVPDAFRKEAAGFLAGCFSLSPSVAMNIAASSPIAVLSGLSAACAAAILAEIGPAVPGGVSLRIGEDGDDGGLSQLQWPRPPHVFGRKLSEFADPAKSREADCPLCGGRIRLVEKGDDFRLEASGAEEKNGQSAYALIGEDGGRPAAETERLPYRYAGRREGDGALSKPAGAPSGLAAYMKPGAFAVVVGKTREVQAIKLAAETMGLTQEEAWDSCQELGLCVVEGVSLAEAKSLKARFSNLGVRVRIARPS